MGQLYFASRRHRYAQTAFLTIAMLAVVLAGTGTAGAGPKEAAGSNRAAPSLSGITLGVTNLYDVTVPAGTWVPVHVSVTNRGTADVRADVSITSGTSFAPVGGCFPDGPTTFTCLSGAGYSASAAVPGPAAGPVPSVESYEVPLALAAGTAKAWTCYVWAGAAAQSLSAAVLGPGRRLLARANLSLDVAAGRPQPSVLAVTDDPSSVASLAGAKAPTGSDLQVQYLGPAELPPTPAPLGTFKAVVIDQAATSVLSPAQAEALGSYVEAGGTLVVAGGLSSLADTAGLPAALLPGRVTGAVFSLALPVLPALLGAPALTEKVDVAELAAAPGSNAVLSQGKVPLTLQANRGNGHVVLSAFDPASPPLADWAGAGALLERLLAPAFLSGYYSPALPYGEAGGIYPVAPADLPPSLVAHLGAEPNTGAPLMSPAVAAGELAGYLRLTPNVATPPSSELLGVLLLGYVLVAGPVSFFMLARLRRRALAWLTVPGLAAAVALVACLTWATSEKPLVVEIRVAQMVPGDHVAQVSSMGVVQLPTGGSRLVELNRSGPAAATLVGSLPGGQQTELVVGPGGLTHGTSLEVSGPPGSSGGWVASEEVRLRGVLGANVKLAGGALRGTVTDGLGAELTDAQVVAGAGEASTQLGNLRPGASARFSLVVPAYTTPLPQAFGAPVPLAPETSVATRHLDLVRLLDDLAATYSAQQGGTPVFIALAAAGTASPDLTSTVRTGGGNEVVVVPMPVTERPSRDISAMPGELVGAAGVTGAATSALTTSSLSLGKGGSFYYQFLLPGTRWRHLALDLGSSSGSTNGLGAGASAFDYAKGVWVPLRVRAVSWELRATVPASPGYVVGGALEVRLRAADDGVEVYGTFPDLAARPAAPALVTRTVTDG